MMSGLTIFFREADYTERLAISEIATTATEVTRILMIRRWTMVRLC